MQKLILLAMTCIASQTYAQSLSNDTTYVKQYSVGLNAMRLISASNSTNPASIGFLQYRINQNAFRLGFSAMSSNGNGSGQNFPGSISITDSTLTLGNPFRHRNGAGVSIEYLRYSNQLFSRTVELYGGAGLYGGPVNRQTGYEYRVYTRDSTGVYQSDNLMQSATEVDLSGSSRGVQLGVIPVIGLVAMPMRTVSFGMELRMPCVYEQSRSYNHKQSFGSFGVDTQLAFNVMINLDAR